MPAKGGTGKIIQSPDEAVSGKRMSANPLDFTYSKGGKVALTAHSRVSADGKTRTVNLKGTDLQSKAVNAVVYDRQ